MIRVQTNFVAIRERQLLTWLCQRLPSWVTPDQLTMLAIVGAAVALAADIASRSAPGFLWLASLGIAIHWFGDSLDGSLARHRRIERPIFGYFLDHTVDAITNLALMVGMGSTLHVRMDVSLFALVGYFLLCMYTFINNHVSGVMKLSFYGFGPTELRLCLIAINTGMYFFGRVGVTVAGLFFSVYDLVLLGAGIGFVILYIALVLAGVRTLRARGA